MVEQKVVFESGNELASYAAKQINYHVMGYYPITPSTEIAEYLDLMKSEGEHDIVMIPQTVNMEQQESVMEHQQVEEGYLTHICKWLIIFIRAATSAVRDKISWY